MANPQSRARHGQRHCDIGFRPLCYPLALPRAHTAWIARETALGPQLATDGSVDPPACAINPRRNCPCGELR
jgi:hypothetical protein